MTWSINASGKKAAAIESVKNASEPSFSENQSVEKTDYARAKQHVLDKLESAPDDADVSVSCSGHGDVKTEGTESKHVGSSESLSISYWVPEKK